MPQRVPIRVHYPLQAGDLALRTDHDWDQDVAAARSSRGRGWFEFAVTTERSHFYFKPVLHNGGAPTWSHGDNYLAIAGRRGVHSVFPNFAADDSCSECSEHVLPPALAAHGYRVRVFLPPGYEENTLARFPVLYMQDGQNLFFPDQAFGGAHWQVRETMQALDAMNLIQRVIVVGIYARERMTDYTKPGYAAYGEFVAAALHPWINKTYRTLPGPQHCGVMGSSLGGVVSFYLAWQWPDVFGHAACLSSTFGYGDDLLERVRREPRRPVRIYLDSGWPNDNYEATRSMRDTLLRRGYHAGVDLFHLAFPRATHDESHWAARAHIPFQVLFGQGRI